MSQTETLMLVALGFALALVLVLLFGRAFWNMAMRLGARRQAKQIPIEMLELQADRDRLRADHAMMSRKLELRLEDIKTRMTEQMAEVSRHRNRVQTMVQDIERRDEVLKIRDREVAALNAQLEVNKADLARCHDTIEKMATDAAAKDGQLSQHGNLITQLSTNLREKNNMVSNLGQELQTALRVGGSIPTQKEGQTENRLMQRVAELTSISSQMSQQREQNSNVLQLNDITHGLAPMETRSRQSSLDQQMADTELESVAMAEQIKALDAIMNQPESVVDASPKKAGAMANVISLAQRIRALQRSVNE
jgi:chromosome segregation ATPase